MKLLLDTNIFVHMGRSFDLAERIDTDHRIFDYGHELLTSFVCVGEINAIIHKARYGEARQFRVKKLLKKVAILEISYEPILKFYEEIDAFSEGKHQSRKGDFSANPMGKNDLWIAATAAAFDLTLVTTDKDFNHLEGHFIDLKHIDIERYRKLT